MAPFGEALLKYRKVVLIMSVVLFAYSTVSFLFSSVSVPRVSSSSGKMVDDQVLQYNMAVRSGSKMDRCVQAGFVASAYTQAKDEANSQAWSGIRNDDCKAAGLAQ